MEVWKPVKNYEETYMISNLGRLAHITKGADSGQGYLVSSLSENKRRRTAFIHQLVCEAFHGGRPDGHIVNHKDGIKVNNYAENLEWVTHSQNHLHAFRNHLRIAPIGSLCSKAKLKESQVVEICNSLDVPMNILAERYGVCRSTISAIQTGSIWKHVDCPRRKIKRKLNGQDVKSIRDSRGTMSQRQLARKFKVSQHLIKEVQLGKVYKNIRA